MQKKKEAVGKYFADFLRTTGIALTLFSGLGLLFSRAEVLNNIVYTVALLVLGIVFVVAGALVVLTSTLDDV